MVGTVFKKGTYVVLLSSCTGKDAWKSSIPEGWVYELSRDSDIATFAVEADIKGGSNSWTLSKEGVAKNPAVAHLKLREATTDEIVRYQKANKPVEASLIPIVNDNYEVY